MLGLAWRFCVCVYKSLMTQMQPDLCFQRAYHPKTLENKTPEFLAYTLQPSSSSSSFTPEEVAVEYTFRGSGPYMVMACDWATDVLEKTETFGRDLMPLNRQVVFVQEESSEEDVTDTWIAFTGPDGILQVPATYAKLMGWKKVTVCYADDTEKIYSFTPISS